MPAARNPWLGVDLGTDPVRLAGLLRRAHGRALSGGNVAQFLRGVVTSSWERSRDAGVDPERHAPPMAWDRGETREQWARHPLSPFAPLISEMLGDFARDAKHIVVVADAGGRLLWSAGHPSVLAASQEIDFVPGRCWAEGAAGTNGVGTALAIDHAVQIFSAEHFNEQVHAWTCTGAPVHDPDSGDVLGVIDLSSGIRAAHPSALALVQATARAVENALLRTASERRERLRAAFSERVLGGDRTPSAVVDHTGRVLACNPPRWLAGRLERGEQATWIDVARATVLEGEPFGDGGFLVRGVGPRAATAAPLELELLGLGRDRLTVRVAGAEFELSPRRSELVAVLALSAHGLSAEELARRLYGDAGRAVTVRAEVCRLRAQLGPILAANPYRLLADVRADFLAAAPPPEAGELLPLAEAPAVVAERRRLRESSARAAGAVAAPSAVW